MNIQIIAAGLVPTPAAGFRTLFIDSSNNGVLTWKLDDGTLLIFSEGEDPDCCSCEIAKEQMKAIACALKNGTISATQYGIIITAGLTVTATEAVVNGVKTCTVVVGANVPAIPPVSIVVVSGASTVAVAETTQMYAVFTPNNTTNQAVVWTSSDFTKVSVNEAGLATGVAIGSATITARSSVNNAITGTKVITVV